MDFEHIPFFDNHTHRINVTARSIQPLELAVAFMHGWGTVNDPGKPLGNSAEVENCTPDYAEHVMNMGVFKALVHQLSKYFGCEATPEAVTAERNRRTEQDPMAYARALYEDGKVLCEVVDDGAPMNDPALQCFPTRILRLFQMDPWIRRALKEQADFPALKAAFDAVVRAKIAEGFIGLKCHMLEILTCTPHAVEDAEAEGCFRAAKDGCRRSFEKVYLALFAHALILTQELDFTVHIHTGTTGNAGTDIHADMEKGPDAVVFSNDPFVLCPFLKDHRYYAARILFLHGAYPDIRRAALMAHAFPNVWLDLGWTLPWIALNFEQVLEEAIAIAPFDKIMLGTGQHNWAEMAWLSAKVAKRALKYVMEKLVAHDMLSENQALEAAEMILSKNAVRLYRL